MNCKQTDPQSKNKTKNKTKQRKFLPERRQFIPVIACVAAVSLVLVSVMAVGPFKGKDVYAASMQDKPDSGHEGEEESRVPTGITGALTGVKLMDSDRSVRRIGTSCEDVIVGQRLKQPEPVETMNVSDVFDSTVNDFNNEAYEKCTQSTIMSDEDYETLLSIVEAEAGGEDLNGRIMVANVIMNRVANDGFPNTVYDVVYEVMDGMAQFTPTVDGRIDTVTVSDTTVEAVHDAIEGTDLSEGALFFVAKEQANQDYVDWFDTDLTMLFSYGVHTFYTYPELADSES